MSSGSLIIILSTAIVLMCVFTVGGFSGLFSELSGVVNIGIDGMMIFGGLMYTVIGRAVGGPDANQIWVIIVAGLATVVFSLLHSFATVTLKANQVAIGTAINLLAAGLAIFLIQVVFQLDKLQSPFSSMNLSGSSGNTSWMYLLSLPIIFLIVIVSVSYVFVYRTKMGFWIRAAGENPNALSSIGKNVATMRYIAVSISGLLAGIGGALVVQYILPISAFTGSVNGIGFLSLAILVFGQWKLPYVFGGAILFSFVYSFSANLNQVPSVDIQPTFALTFPFVISLLVLVLFSRRANSPSALGVPYDRSKR